MGQNNGHGNGHKGKGKKGGGATTVKSLIRDYLNSKSLAPLSSQAGKREINAAARLRFGPLQREQEALIRASEAQTKRDKGYYQDYLKKVANLQQGTTGIYKDANSQLAQAQKAAGQQDTGLLNMLGANQARMQALTGAPSQTAALNPLAQAQSIRGTDALNNQARQISQGANQRSYMVDQRRIGQASKAQALVQGGARTLSLSQQLSDLAREKGAFKADLLRENRDADRGLLIDLLSGPNARKYLKLQQKGSEDLAKLNNKLDPPGKDKEKPGKGGDTDAQDQKQKNKEDRQDARALLLNMQDNLKPGQYNVSTLAAALVNEDIPADIARQVAKWFLRNHEPPRDHTPGGNPGGGGGTW